MKQRRLGHTDLHVATLGLGTMQFGWTADKPTSFAILDAYVARGGNFLDTADAYSFWALNNPGGVSETWIGEWLASRQRRNQIVIATKVGLRMWEGPDGKGLGRTHIIRGVEASLRRLNVETIDLYQAHWPDDATPIEETMRAFDELVRAGKVRYVGCSNYSAKRLRDALDASAKSGYARYASLQPHYNLVRRAEFEGDLENLCARENIGVIPYSSLARGFLTGIYRRNQPTPDKARKSDSLSPLLNDAAFGVVDQLDLIAQTHHITLSQVALAWLLANPVIASTIIGASTLAQLEEILSDDDFTLTSVEKQSLDAASNWSTTTSVARAALLRSSE